MKNIIFCLMMMVSTMATSAYYNTDITNLTDFVGDHGIQYNKPFTGKYWATGVGYEAAKTSLFWSGTKSIFTTGRIPDGEWCCQVDWDDPDAGFWTKNNNKWEGPSDNFMAYLLTSDWSPYGDSLKFKKGTFILGLGDGHGDGDYDDLIIAMKSNAVPNAVPIPAAVWLFISGLLGMAAMSKRKV